MVTLQIFLAISLALPCSMENDITPSIKNKLQFQGMYVPTTYVPMYNCIGMYYVVHGFLKNG